MTVIGRGKLNGAKRNLNLRNTHFFCDSFNIPPVLIFSFFIHFCINLVCAEYFLNLAQGFENMGIIKSQYNSGLLWRFPIETCLEVCF
jgi:hypothetical protein